MMKADKHKLTLYRPATYEIKVPGHLDDSWSEWAEGMTFTVENEAGGPQVTTLTCTRSSSIAGPPTTALFIRVASDFS